MTTPNYHINLTHLILSTLRICFSKVILVAQRRFLQDTFALNRRMAEGTSKASVTPKMHLMRWSDVKFDSLFAGVCGGVISTAVLHPLDLVKIRLQGMDFLSCLYF